MKKTGIELIAAERQEQIEKHGYTVESDAMWANHQLVIGAVSLLNDASSGFHPIGWDTILWEKMAAKSYKDRLIIAGALIAAEIDKRQYCEETPMSICSCEMPAKIKGRNQCYRCKKQIESLWNY